MNEFELDLDMDLDLNKEEIISTFTTEEIINELRKRENIETIEIKPKRGTNIFKEDCERTVVIYRKITT